MVLNSLSSPPMPMVSNLKSGCTMALAAGLLLEALRFIGALDLWSLKKFIVVLRKSMPRARGSDTVGAVDDAFSMLRSPSCTVRTVNLSGILLWSINSI